MAKILIVEDRHEISRLYASALIKHGHTVVVSCSTFQALAVTKKEAFGLILLDLKMPDYSGEQLPSRNQDNNSDQYRIARNV